MPINGTFTRAISGRRPGQAFAPNCALLILLLAIVTLTGGTAHGANGSTPVITAAVNESVRAELHRGSPLLLEVDLLHPDSFASNPQPLLIDMVTAPWSSAVRIEIKDTNDQAQVWPLSLFSLTSNNLALDGSTGGQLLYYLTPEQTATLALGSYTIEVQLNTTNSTSLLAWKGVVQSVPVDLAVADEPPTLTPDERAMKQQLLASYHLLQDDASQAGAEIDALLATYPDSIAGLSFKSYLLQLEGRNVEAEQLLSRAIEITDASFPDAQEPPVELIRRRNEFLKLPGPIVIRLIKLQSQSLTLIWDSNPGEKYSVEASSDLSTWQPMASDLTADSDIFLWTGTAGSDAAFFRIRR